ncbi:unnamed protein product [Caenorhabditis brenneri]
MANRAPRRNMDVETVMQYIAQRKRIQDIRRDNGLRGIVANCDHLMREQLAVLRQIIICGLQEYSQDGQNHLEYLLRDLRRLIARQRQFEGR